MKTKLTLGEQIDKQAEEIKELQAIMYEPIYNFDQAEKIAKADYIKLDQARANGKLKVIQIGSLKGIRRKDLLEWMKTRKKK